MENKFLLVVAVVLAALCLGASAMSLPKDAVESNDVQVSGPAGDLDDQGRRATWLDTRDLEDELKELVFLSLQELQNEGRIADGVVKTNIKEKRGRWQGFCFRRTRSGRFLPYICWKGARK
jgi:hypothetical protein